jgi:predicted AAA+ superfamily ATPase
MKRIVDQRALDGRDNAGMFWLTGSQKFKMMQDVADSLSGRIAVFDLSSLSAAEIEHRSPKLFCLELGELCERFCTSIPKSVHQIYDRIFRGGMPKLHTTALDRDRFYADYVNTYLERDIKDLAQVGKLNEFYDFLVFMAARTAQKLKYDEIANAIGVSSPTATKGK